MRDACPLHALTVCDMDARLAAAAAFGPGTFIELGEACTSPTLSDYLLSL